MPYRKPFMLQTHTVPGLATNGTSSNIFLLTEERYQRGYTVTPQREQAPRSRQPCSSCIRRGGRLRCARFVSATNGYEIVTVTRIAVTLVDLVMK